MKTCDVCGDKIVGELKPYVLMLDKVYIAWNQKNEPDICERCSAALEDEIERRLKSVGLDQGNILSIANSIDGSKEITDRCTCDSTDKRYRVFATDIGEWPASWAVIKLCPYCWETRYKERQKRISDWYKTT